MEYNTKVIIDNLDKDLNDDYIVYYEDKTGDHTIVDLTGKDAKILYNQKKIDCNCKYVELQYDPQEDEELEDRIVLMTCSKREINLLGNIIYLI